MKKRICWFLLLAALFATTLFCSPLQPVSAQDEVQYVSQGETPAPPQHLLQQMEIKNKLQTGRNEPAPQTERPQEPQWTIPYYEDQKYIHEWTAGVFSAWNYTTGNYDLLMRMTILNDPTVIAGSAGDEIYPRLSRDSSAVIYSSDESGDMEIYRMNINGSGKTNLTNTPGEDYSAVWSLDNQWIAYVHKIGNIPQVYVMRADGSEKRKITACSLGCFDPSFSPDASQITFVEKLNGSPYSRIIVSNRDGSGRRTLFADYQVLLPAHPSWSPNGDWIAFDYYQYPHAYSRMGRVHPDGTSLILNQQFSPYSDMDGYLTDYWINGWGPDSGFLTVTVIHYVKDASGNYIFDGSDALILLTSGGGPAELACFYVLQGGTTWFLDFQSADRTPPESALESLPAFSRGMLTLEWNSSSTGLARPTEVQLQRREGVDGIWQDIANTASAFGNIAVPAGTPGLQTYFRVRAKDAAQQWEEWPETPSRFVFTTNYLLNVKGRIFDNRNNPIVNQGVAMSSPPLIGGLTDGTGLFQTLLSTHEPVILSVNRNGYGELQPVQLLAQRDSAYDSYLPPIMNLITNGDFENSLSGWVTGGNFPVDVSASSRHTGEYSLILGEDCTAPCFSSESEFIADGIDISSHLVDDLHGTLYAFQGRTIRYRENNGSWIGPIDFGSYILEAIASSTGRFYAIFQKSDGFWGIYRDPEGEWSEQFFIGRIGSSSRIFFDDMDVDENNHLHFVATISYPNDSYWLNHYLFNPDTRVLTETKVGQSDPSAKFSVHHVPGGKVLLTNFSNGEFTYYVQDDAGKWRRFYVSNPPVGVYGDSYEIGLDANDHILLLRADNQGDNQSKLTMQTMDKYMTWSEPLTIHTAYNLFVSNTTRCPDGTTFFSIGDYGAINQVFRMGKGSAWELTSFQLPEDAYRLYCDSDGIPIIETLDSYHDSRLIRIANDSTAGVAEISQQVNILADMPKPTLAFALRLDNVRLVQQTALEVIVRDATETETTLLSIKKSGDWRQEWVDLSPWAGQTVTIIFRLNQAANEPKAKAWIDGVSLGSWETVILESVEPYRFTFQQDAPILTVHGQNFHEGLTVQINGMDVPPERITLLNENTLTVLTPDFIRPGFNSLRVTNPGGAYTELPYAFRTGLELFLPVVNR